MRSFFQQEPGFCLRLLRGLTAFFSRFGQNLNFTISHRHRRTLTLINRTFETRRDRISAFVQHWVVQLQSWD